MLSSIKKTARHKANEWLIPRGLELTHRRLEASPVDQLMLALRHFGIDLIIDVGANSGQYAAELFEKGYTGRIVSIEPQPQAHAALKLAAQRVARWEVLDAVAIGEREGEVDLNVAGNSLSSSVLPMLPLHERAAPGSASIGTIRVPLRTLDSLVVGHVHAAAGVLVKVDTQGYEYPVLKGAAQCIGQARLVQLELSLEPLYEGQKLWQELIAEMAARGYTVWSLQPEFCDRETGRLLQINGLFARLGD